MTGDVHDIGKNLVEIILANNRYSVINLGIKVPAADLVRAVREHRPDAIGLSGLLVKSAHQMVTMAAELRRNGVDVPLLVGGAALSESFVRTRIGPAYGAPTFYAEDAMAGLRIMNELVDPVMREAAITATSSGRRRLWDGVTSDVRPKPDARTTRAARKCGPMCRFPQRRLSIVREIRDLPDVWRYQSVHALRPSPRVQRAVRAEAGRARPEGARAL